MSRPSLDLNLNLDHLMLNDTHGNIYCTHFRPYVFVNGQSCNKNMLKQKTIRVHPRFQGVTFLYHYGSHYDCGKESNKKRDQNLVLAKFEYAFIKSYEKTRKN